MLALRQFHNFYQAVVRRNTTQHQTVFCQNITVFVVKFITVAMTFVYQRLSVSLIRQRTGVNLAGIQTQPHGAALIFNIHLVRHQVDDRRNLRPELAAVGILHAADIPGEFDNGALHTQADAEERNLMFPGIANGRNLAFNAPVSETAGNQNAVHACKDFVQICARSFDFLRVHPADIQLRFIVQRRVFQRFRNTDVGVLQFHIFAGHRNGHFPVVMLQDTGHHIMPAGHILRF